MKRILSILFLIAFTAVCFGQQPPYVRNAFNTNSPTVVSNIVRSLASTNGIQQLNGAGTNTTLVNPTVPGTLTADTVEADNFNISTAHVTNDLSWGGTASGNGAGITNATGGNIAWLNSSNAFTGSIFALGASGAYNSQIRFGSGSATGNLYVGADGNMRLSNGAASEGIRIQAGTSISMDVYDGVQTTNRLILENSGRLVVNGGGVTNLPMGATFMLPPKLWFVSGYEGNLWKDGAVYLDESGPRVNFTSSSFTGGAAMDGRFKLLTTGLGTWATNTLTLDVSSGGRHTNAASTVIIAPTNAGSGITRNLLLIGDSTGAGFLTELKRIFSTNDMALTLQGTWGGSSVSTATNKWTGYNGTVTNWVGTNVLECSLPNGNLGWYQAHMASDAAGLEGFYYFEGWFRTGIPTNSIGFKVNNNGEYNAEVQTLSTNWQLKRFAVPAHTGTILSAFTPTVGGLVTQISADPATPMFCISNLVCLKIATNGIRHQAYGGASFETFATSGTISPLVQDGSLNFSRYVADNAIVLGSADWVILHLGLNNIGVASTASAAAAAIASEWSYASNIVRSIHAYNPNIRCALITTWPGAASQDAWGANYGIALWGRDTFRYASSLWNKKVITDYAAIGVAEVLAVGAQVDTEYGFPTTTAAHSYRVTNVVSRYSNGVHPSEAGYNMASDAYFHFLKANQ